MKLGLAVLPMEVWADVFVYPCISREKLGQIVDQFGERTFAEKMQKLLHGCGRQTLRHLDISCKSNEASCKYQLRKRQIFETQASLAVAPLGYPHAQLWPKPHSPKRTSFGFVNGEFPHTEMPENVQFFKALAIRYIDDQVLAFLAKIKPLFNNVILRIEEFPARNMRIFLGHLLPMISSIRGISCGNVGINVLTRHFPDKLARAKELDLQAEPVQIPTCLMSWLNTSQDLDVDGPRFLKMDANSDNIAAMIAAVRQQFLAAANPFAFVIYLQHNSDFRAEIQTIDNAATKEQLAIQNATFKRPMNGRQIHYVEILRYPIGADARIREWLKQRAFYEKKFKENGEEQLIWIAWPRIGRITKNKKADRMGQEEDESADDGRDDEAGPSNYAKKMKK